MDTSSRSEQRTESTAILEASVPDTDAPGCSAAVGIEGEVVWEGARGLANAETGARLETSTRMDLASTEKQFTAMAVLMLVEGCREPPQPVRHDRPRRRRRGRQLRVRRES